MCRRLQCEKDSIESLGVRCESLSRVRYHLGCSGDDKAQVQGPVIVGFVFVCVGPNRQREKKDLSQT